jgi:hypothetical protein
MRGESGIVNKELTMMKPGTQDQVEAKLHDLKEGGTSAAR